MKRLASAACAATATCAFSAHAGQLTSFDMPGRTAICGFGITDDGTVAGNSVGTSAPTADFLFRKGVFTALSPAFPNGLTGVSGINQYRSVVGTNGVFGSNFTYTATGFVLRRGTTTKLQIPGAADVFARAISGNDTIVGSYDTSSSSADLFGFIRRGTSVTTLNDGSNMVEPTGIDPAGIHIVGYSGSTPAGHYAGWVYTAGRFSLLNVTGATDTLPNGINDAGTVSGSYLLSDATIHGFIYKSAVFTTYDVPAASMTELNGINAHGVVTGCYTDSVGTHGLIYQP